MTKTRPKSDLGRVKRRLRKVGELIETVNEDRDALYEERLALWKELADAGIDRTELASLAGTTPGMVKFAFSADRKRSATATG